MLIMSKNGISNTAYDWEKEHWCMCACVCVVHIVHVLNRLVLVTSESWKKTSLLFYTHMLKINQFVYAAYIINIFPFACTFVRIDQEWLRWPKSTNFRFEQTNMRSVLKNHYRRAHRPSHTLKVENLFIMLTIKAICPLDGKYKRKK